MDDIQEYYPSIAPSLIDSMNILEPNTYASRVDKHILKSDCKSYPCVFLDSHPIFTPTNYLGEIYKTTPRCTIFYNSDLNRIVFVPAGNFNSEIEHWITRDAQGYNSVINYKKLHKILEAEPKISYLLRDPVIRALNWRKEQYNHFIMMTGHFPKLEEFNPTLSFEPAFQSQLSYIPVKITRPHWNKVRSNFTDLIRSVYKDIRGSDLWNPYIFWHKAISADNWLYDVFLPEDFNAVDFFWLSEKDDNIPSLAAYLEIEISKDYQPSTTDKFNSLEYPQEQIARLRELYAKEYEIFESMNLIE